MDPNATLRELRNLAAHILMGRVEGDYEELEDLAEELAESALALDEWLSGGGFLPADWEK